METLLIYLLTLCQAQARELEHARAVILEQALQLASTDGLLADLDKDMNLLENELDGIFQAIG
jgi:hypothetical protein